MHWLLFIMVSVCFLECATFNPVPLVEKARLEIPRHMINDNTNPDEPLDQNQISDSNQVSPDLKSVQTTSTDQKGRTITTVFTGAVLERKIVKRMGLDIVQIIIQGSAQIQYDKITIRAHKMVIEDNRVGQLSGRVHVIDRQSGVHLFGQKAIWNRDEQFVALEGLPYMLLYSKNKQLLPGENSAASNQKPALVTCNRITRDLENKISRLLGDVRIHQSPWNLLGDLGTYQDGSDKLVLTKNPVILGENRYMVADTLEYIPSQKKIVLISDVILLSRGNALLPSNEKKPDSSQTLKNLSLEEFGRMGGRLTTSNSNSKEAPGSQSGAEEISVLSARRVSFVQAQNNQEAQTVIEGDVILSRRQLRVSSPSLTALGNNYHSLYTEQGIELLDRSQNMHVTAGVMDYRIKDQYLRLEKNPVIEFLNAKSGEVESVLKAAVIERNFETETMIARGNVILKQNNFEAQSETARYKQKEGVIILEGNPGIVNGDSLIRSEKILYYPEKKRVFLYKRIRGFLGLRKEMYGST